MVRRSLPRPPDSYRPPPYQVPLGYRLIETADRVPDVADERGYWWRWRAQRWADRMNAGRRVPSYRYTVVDTHHRWPRPRYFPVAFQNVLEPLVRMKEDDHA